MKPANLMNAGNLLHELVARQTARTPHAVAVTEGKDQVTYRELDARANHLAWVLRAEGIGPESVVGVCLERGIDLVVSHLAVLKAGGAFLALDPSDPIDRLTHTLDDASATVVLSDTAVRKDWTVPMAVHLLDVTEVGRTASERPCPPSALRGENSAYVIYTSGSTGRPKGVRVPHQGIVNLVAWHVRTHRLTGEDRCALLARVAFDAICWETWPALAAGAALVAAPADIKHDPDATLAWLDEESITVAFLPPLLAERLYHSHLASRLKLRVLLTGSDRLAQHPPAGLPFAVFNHYGPTEYSVVGSAGVVPAGRAGAPTIGSPIDNTEVRILDDHMNQVAVGVTGTIHLSGVGLAHGYLTLPALTAERFLPDPFAELPGARMYATGDLGSWNDDGTIAFHGRVDRQVKIRGYRVESGEIETRLLAHPRISEAAVVADRDSAGGARLVAYVVATSGGHPTEGELTRHLSVTLPEYMIPRTFHPLAALPKNANGKIDYTQLPTPTTDRPNIDTPYVGPRNQTEELIARIWAEVLDIDTVGVYDNFFDLGGHSLLGTEVVDRIATELRTDLDVRAVFDYPTIAELAASLS